MRTSPSSGSKAVGLQPRARAAFTSIDAEILFVPLSYFWICWNVMFKCRPRTSCDIPADFLRLRSLNPTATSIGSGP